MSTQLSPIDLATAAVEQQRRLVADAQRIATAATERHLDQEHAVGKAERAEAAAAQASLESPEDAALADAFTRSRTALADARRLLEIAVKDDKQAAQRAKESAEHLESAQKALVVAELEARFADGSFEREMEAHAAAIVDSMKAASGALSAIHAAIVHDGEQFARYVAAGGNAAFGARDGTVAAGFAIARLLELGASGSSLTNVHAIRWVFDPAGRPGSQYRDSKAAAAAFMELAFSMLAQADRDERSGAGGRGRHELERAAKIWPGVRNSSQARIVTEGDERGKVRAVADENRFAHEMRLARAAGQRDARAGRSFDQNGRVIGPPPAALPRELHTELPPGPRPYRRVSGLTAAEDFPLEGTADAPGGTAFPTSPPSGMPRRGG